MAFHLRVYHVVFLTLADQEEIPLQVEEWSQCSKKEFNTFGRGGLLYDDGSGSNFENHCQRKAFSLCLGLVGWVQGILLWQVFISNLHKIDFCYIFLVSFVKLSFWNIFFTTWSSTRQQTTRFIGGFFLGLDTTLATMETYLPEKS